MFVLLSRFLRPPNEIGRSLEPHGEWVQRHYASGHFLVSGRRDPWIGGVIVARAESEQEVLAALATDPLQQLGLVAYEIIAFDAADFPKRSGAFDTFASQPLDVIPPGKPAGS